MKSCTPTPASLLCALLIPLALCAATSSSAAITDLPVYHTELFSTSGKCSICHVTNGNDVLVDGEGNDLTNSTAWRSTMMANAFRDPYFRARMEAEINRNPHLQETIEDSCLTCHAPMGHRQSIYNGETSYTLASAETDILAQDGVSCTVCHQIQPANLGTDESFTGGYEITTDRHLFGPYEDINVLMMEVSSGFTPVYGEHMKGSSLCATCHTLFTPYVNDLGEVAGEFPEQTPYLEWLNSVYSQPGPDARDCQTCHMPVLHEAIVIASIPPGLAGQTPFWQHHFAAGNSFMLEMLRDNGAELAVTATDEHFNTTIQRSLDQLANAVDLQIVEVTEGNPTQVVVEVTNLTGHKFPTSYPERRAWIRLTARDGQGQVIFDSGAWTASGEIVGLDAGFEPHHDVITSDDQVMVYEMVMGDVNGAPTHTLLRAAQRLKDNRLPPRGFVADGPSTEVTSVMGLATSDPNFNIADAAEGSGRDIVTYQIPLGDTEGPISIEARLVYQSIAPAAVEDLLLESTPMVTAFAQMYQAMDNSPVEIISQTHPVSGENGLVIR